MQIIFQKVMGQLQEISNKIDAIIIPEYIDPMIEVRNLCKKQKENDYAAIITDTRSC